MPNHKKFKKPPPTAEQKKNLSKAMRGNQNAVGNKGGRPKIEYTRTIGKKVRDMLMAQFTVDKIAEILEISRDTLFRWKNENTEFRDFWEYGLHGIDSHIVRSLAKRAVGFKKRVEKPVKVKDDKTGADRVINHVYSEYYPPDVRAVEIWLRNRSQVKKDWSNLPVEDVPPPLQPVINVNQIDLSKLDDATIRKIIAAAKSPDTEG